MRYAKLWLALVLVFVASFSILGYYGLQIYRQAPPIPSQVRATDGRILFTENDIRLGQNVWQSIGGQQIGSIWGHGAYVAPDWSADWLHRESILVLDTWAQAEHGRPFAELNPEIQAGLQQRLVSEMRTNTYDPATGVLTISPARADAVERLGRYYAAIFGDAQSFDPEVQPIADAGRSPQDLRNAYAIATQTVRDPQRQAQMNAFFFWAAWSCAAERPAAAAAAGTGSAGGDAVAAVSFTNNWPHEPLVGNRPSGSIVVWSMVSVVLLIAGVGALVWQHARVKAAEALEPEVPIPARDPLLHLNPTPSMRATLKYFWVVAALIVVQVGLGGVTAHYGVEGQGFFGIPLAEILPYAVTRTWHTQLGIFWIATAWLATGLFIAPAVSGHEPRFQRLGVNLLFAALLIIVVGTLFGTWYATRQRMGLATNFWFGHQGYEYVDLGRFWQLFLFVGLFLWLGLVVRAIWPAFKQPGQHKHLLALFLIASAAIGLFYGAGLMWGRHTHLAMAEYWRWWVVHLWVEGFFEVFATVVIAFLFTRMGLLRATTATASVLFATTVFLAGGILGTLHHLYFSGTPTAVLAFGAVFSALEIVPLTLIGFEAYENLHLVRAKPWVQTYKWPILFFVGVAFWNLVGAGIFGFLINPPIALYYMQGLNTTPVHGHTALFGVYGMLGIGLMLFSLRGLSRPGRAWRTGALSLSFWSLNLGLILMVALSLLPIGILQTFASVDRGLWFARSAEFLQTPLMDNLRWLRVVGDVVFSVGVLALGWFVLGLITGWSYQSAAATQPQAQPDAQPAMGK